MSGPQIRAELVLDTDKFTKGTKAAIDNANGLTSGLKQVGKGMVLGAGIASFNLLNDAVSAGIGFVGDSIDAASNLSESLSKLDVVFGESAAGIEAWSKDSATNLGISQQAAVEAAGTFGNLFTAMGIGVPQAADMSQGLVTLASDLASFNNADPAEVLESLRSGLTGETEPLKKFGININEATLKAKAMELGLWDGKGALDAGAKAQASYALILEQTTSAQGDFARTSDGLANKQRIADAKLKDLSATIGSKLQPVMIAVQTFIADDLIPALTDIYTKIQPIISTIIDALIPAFQAAGPVIGGIMGSIGEAITALMPVFKVILAVAVQVFKGIGAAIGIAAGVIKTYVGIITTVVKTVIKVFQGVASVVQNVFRVVSSVIRGAINAVIRIVNFVIGAMNRIQVHIHVGPVNLDWNGLQLRKIPTLHAGGIVPGKPGTETLALLQAGERVIPRNRAKVGTGDIVFNFYGPVYGQGPALDDFMHQVTSRVRVATGL